MTEKLRLNQAVIVEGRYDKIKLESIIDALILPVGGFTVFSDSELRGFIKKLADERGIILLTDSDGAGFKIRHFIKGLTSPEKVTHVYIPDLFGKEKRKKTSSKEGKLGVEGMDRETLLEAFRRAGITGDIASVSDPVTRADFYEDGLTGGANSRSLRWALYERLGLPRRLNTSDALNLIGRMLTRDEYKALITGVKAGLK